MSRIVEVEVIALEIPFAMPVETASGRWLSRRLGIVRASDDAGRVGLGELASEHPSGRAAATDARDARTSLVGLDVADDEALAALGTGSAALVSAVLDLRARAADGPVAKLLAGEPSASVAVNGFIGILATDEATAAARGLVDAGVGCLKLKGGREPDDALVDRVVAVRATVGPRVGLRLDLNGALEPAEAAALLDALGGLDLEYVEQPIGPRHGADALARLRRTTAVPIAADEAVADVDSARALVEAGAVDVLVVKPARVGGLLRAWAIARMAAEAGVAVVCSTLFETGVGIAGALHLAAALPGAERAHGLSTAGLLAADPLIEPLGVASGRMALPAGPGLGVALDPDVIGAYAR